MSRPGVVLLITAGVVIANQYYGRPSLEAPRDLTEITRISVAPDRGYTNPEVIPTFVPTTPAVRKAISDSAGEPAARPLPKPGAWTTTVVTAGRSVVSPVRTSGPTDWATRNQLTQDLQRELQRVGCYQGEITGSWTASTRRAMSAFMDRANAVLPFNEPDYVLLALVQSHREVTCAAECPVGESAQDDGRCVPAAVIAQAAKHQKRLKSRALEEDPRLANKRADEEARDRIATSNPPSQPEVLPWLSNKVDAEPLAEVASQSRPDPLPGRMSIGGPIPPSDGAQQPVPIAQTLPPAASTSDASAKLAALQADPDADDLSDGARAGALDVPAVVGEPEAANAHKTKKHADRDNRRRRDSDGYAYSGRHRRADPRPGTARFNLMQTLGGIY